ncbi:MAG: hypothetical protein JXA10_20190 [Anaerolineae bacterium]|nr:hypothetical protein [Anaerolineae bacterium]
MLQERYSDKFDPTIIRDETEKRMWRLGLVSVLIAIAFFELGLLLFAVVGGRWLTVEWSLLEGVASLATLALIIGGLIFAIFEHVNNDVQEKRESAKSSFGIYKELFDRITSPEDTTARRWIILNIAPLDDEARKDEWLEEVKAKFHEMPDGWEGEIAPGHAHLKRILNTFDFIGFVSSHYWNMDGALVEWMSPPFAKVWERIGTYVEDEAERRQEDDYYKSAREFARYCLQWRQENCKKSVIIDHAT